MGLPGADLAGRIAGAVLASQMAQEVARAVIRAPLLDVIVDELAQARVVERLADQLVTEEVLDEVVARLLATDELWVLVDVVASSPAVTEAIGQQGLGFADQVADVVRGRTRTADARLERMARRALRRRARSDGAAG